MTLMCTHYSHNVVCITGHYGDSLSTAAAANDDDDDGNGHCSDR